MPAATSKLPLPQAKEKIGPYPTSAGRSINNYTPPPTARPKQRNSILVAASDALNFSLRRSKRPTILHTNNQKHRPSVVDEVLEISAEAAQKDELAERERLRDAAAQAVGLGGTTSSESTMAANTMDDVSVMSSHTRSAKRTTVISIHQPLSHANQNMSALPPYPATLNSLQPFIQHSSVLLKYYPSQSAFLKLQKSRQWKLRHLVLTSFRCPSESESSTGTGDNATQAQLHLFKSSNGEEKEIERLCINQDSVIYVADGGFGGNKEFVVKVAGYQRAEGAPTSSNNPPSSAAATVWLLQLPDLAQMQRWIQFIKSSVLTQRAERAGLGPQFYNNTYSGSGPELKGDLDLMISMGKQGLLPGTPQLSTFEGGMLASRDKAERDSNTSVRSKQSTVANASSSSSGAVSALKGLFNGRPISRQLSSSRTSIGPSGPPTQPQPQPQPQPQDGEAAIVQSAEEPGQTTRHETFMRGFRPTSPPAVGHPTTLSPPLSPSHSLVTDESTLNPASPTLSSHPPISGARHYLSGGSATSSRKLAHSNSFSIDWDAIDGSYSTHQMSGTHEKRISAASMALTPPPRNRRPWTTSTIPSPGSGGKIDWSTREREKLSSAGTPVINLDLTSPMEKNNHPLDAQGSPRIESVREGSTAEGTIEEASLPGTNGDDDDDDDVTTTNLPNDAVRTDGFPAPIPHIPSPIVTPAPLLHSSASSFAGGASNHNQSNRHSTHSVRNSTLSERSPRPPSRASIASYDTDAQHPPSLQHAIREVSELDPPPSADLGPSPISFIDHDRARQVRDVKETTERPNSFGFDPPSDLEVVNSGRPRLGPLQKQTLPHAAPPPAASALGMSSSSLRSPSPTPENASGHHSHDRPPTPTSLNSTVPSVGGSLTGRHPQTPSLNGHTHPHSKRISTISSTSARSGWSATSGSSNIEQPRGSFGVPTGGPIGHTAPRALKVSTGSVSSQGPGSSLVHGSGNRISILPPQRPIPSAALPSPPIGEVPDRRQSYLSNRSIAFSSSDSMNCSPSRPEFTLRSSRMSMAPPAPPPQGALPPRPDEVSRLSMSSFGSGTNLLHPIPASPPTGTASLHHGIVPPPTTSPPMRPLPPTPEVLQERPQSPALSVHSTHSNKSVGSLSKLPSLRFRLRMMNSSSASPTAAPPGSEVALPETRRLQQLSRLPPAPPPPTSAPPSIPSLPSTSGHRGHGKMISDVPYSQTIANSSTVPPSPIGEAITSRLEQYPLSTILPMSSSHAQSYPSRRTSPQHMSYVRPLPQFPPQQPPNYERHSLSPPPRRNSRASQYPPPSEKDRERTDSLTRRQRLVPEESAVSGRVVQMKHSAINLAGEGGGPFSSNL